MGRVIFILGETMSNLTMVRQNTKWSTFKQVGEVLDLRFLEAYGHKLNIFVL